MKKLKGKLIEKGYTYENIASELGISKTTFAYKINGKGCFLITEASKLKELLNLTERESIEIFLE